MDRPNRPPAKPAISAATGAGDVAPLSVVRPGQFFSTTSFARVRTRKAFAYLEGLNQGWRRHVEVVADSEAHAEAVFPMGHAELEASAEFLEVSLRARSDHEAALLEDLVSDSLDRLALDLDYQWVRSAPAAASSYRWSRP
jgi:hypothetical protein